MYLFIFFAYFFGKDNDSLFDVTILQRSNTWKIYIPLTALKKILLGALKWNGPLDGFTLHLYVMYFSTFTVAENYKQSLYLPFLFIRTILTQ